MKVHHAVAKKAAKHNIKLVQSPDQGETMAEHADLKEPIRGADPTKVLNEALKTLGYKTSKPKGKKKDKAAKAAIVANKSVVRKPYKDIYKTKGSGQGNGDRLDAAMKDALEGDENALVKVSKENNIPFVWQVLNKGLQRMNLTNVLRARIKRGEKVFIMGKTIASL